MAMANPQPDPSMDEILASIRAIISEDDEGASAPAAQQAAVSKDVSPAGASAVVGPKNISMTPAPQPVPVQAPEPEASPVAQLQETAAQAMAVPQESAASKAVPLTTDNLQADTATPVQEKAPQAQNVQMESMDEAAVFEPEKGTAVEEAGAVTLQSSAAAMEKGTAPKVTQEAETKKMATPPPAPAKPASTQQETAVPDGLARKETGLMDDVTYASAASVLGSLSQSVRISSGQGGQTLEDVVCKVLEPLLKQWLDENLLPIVEDKVEEEVRRLARRR